MANLAISSGPEGNYSYFKFSKFIYDNNNCLCKVYYIINIKLKTGKKITNHKYYNFKNINTYFIFTSQV